MNDKAKKNVKKRKHHHPKWFFFKSLHIRRMREITIHADPLSFLSCTSL